MFVDSKFYNDVYRIRKKSFMKYFLLYLFLQFLLTTLPELPAIQMILAGTIIDPFKFTEVANTSFLLSFSCSIILQFVTVIILMQLFRIIQGSYTKLIDLFEPLREKWLIILCISAFIAFLDNLFIHNISNTILLVILKLALYYLTIFIAFSIYTYPTHTYQDGIRNSIKEAIDSLIDIIKIDIHYMWICLAALLLTILVLFYILKTVFGGALLVPLVTLDNPSALITLSKSMLPLFTALFIAIILVSILTQHRLFCAYYAHALYYFKKYVEIKPEIPAQGIESTYIENKDEEIKNDY